MSTPAKKIIKKLQDDDDLREDILRWVVSNKYHKRYEHCTSELSDECVGVGLKTTFHGKQCPACRIASRKQLYEKGRKEKKQSD